MQSNIVFSVYYSWGSDKCIVVLQNSKARVWTDELDLDDLDDLDDVAHELDLDDLDDLDDVAHELDAL